MDAHLIASGIVTLAVMLVGFLATSAMKGVKADIIEHQNKVSNELKLQLGDTRRELEVHVTDDSGKFRRLDDNDARQEAAINRLDNRLTAIRS